MNKIEIIKEIETKMNKDKKLKNLKIFASIFDYGHTVATSIIVEGIKSFNKVNYIEERYNLVVNQESLTTGQIEFNRNLA